MQVAVLADVHGNLPALEAVLADLRRHDLAGIIVAGDLVDGLSPRESIQLLRSLNSWIIQSNSDASFVRLADGKAPPAWHTALQYALLRWGVRELDRETLDYLASLPEQRVVSLPGTAATAWCTARRAIPQSLSTRTGIGKRSTQRWPR